MRSAERPGHRPLAADHVPGLLRRQQRLEIGVDFGGTVGKPLFQFHLVGLGRAADGNLESIREMQRVVNGADRAKLDGYAAQPVQDPAGRLIMAKRAAVVETDIPGEAVPRKGVSESSDCLCLLEKQDLVLQPG